MAYVICVHFCSWLLFMPVGWCCWLPTLRAAQTPEQINCCCCAKPENTKPTKPGEEAPQAPSCCCDPQPAILAPSDHDGKQLHDVLPVTTDLLAGLEDLSSVPAGAILPFLNDPSPPLRILHCTWLC